MSAATVVPLANAFLQSTASSQFNEAEEYEKILKLRDEIFAGTHPRLIVPAHATRRLSPPPATHLSSAAHTNVPPPFASTQQNFQLPGLSLNSHEISQSQQPQKIVNNVVSTQSEPSTSGYDPILLVKSDELVKAETRMYRERLEKALKDQFEQKRLDARKRPAPGEAKPDFDVATVLTKALEIAKPEHLVTAVSPRDDVSNSQSYDENSLYSSRGPDSTPEAGELDDDDSSSHNQQSFAEGLGANGTAEVPMRSSQHVPPAVLPHQANSKPIYGQSHPITSKTFPASAARNNTQTFDLTTLDNDDEDEEGEYSPPEAMDQVAPNHGSNGQALDPRSRPLRRYSELEENGRRPDEGNMRIVRNHITSPVAPQPSRVSPLAVAKDSVILQNPRGRTGRTQRGRDDSPEAGQHLPPKKKRKIDKKAEKRRRSGKGSPDIKDEPVSPPPFHNVQPLGSGRSRPATDDRPILLDDIAADPEIRYIRSSDRYIDTPTRPLSRYAEPMLPLSEPRVMSRTSMRPMADSTDLRRIASLHNMRAEPPRDYVDQVFESPTRARASSYIQVDSPIRVEGSRQYQDMPVAYEREDPPGMGIARSPMPAYQEVYQENRPEVRYVPEAMPPPPMERIIVDKYGRRFREIIQQDRASVAPRAAPSYVEREQPVYYDTFDRPRAGSVMLETAPEQRYVQEMPPPTRLARPMVDPNSARLSTYEPLSGGRSTSVVPTGTPTHQPIYNNVRSEYREPMRMSSVRPALSRYDEQPSMQVMGRAPSVRPQTRETSYLVEDRGQARQDYLPMESTPQYRMVDQQPRYFDAQGREVVMEVPQDRGQKYVQRY